MAERGDLLGGHRVLANCVPDRVIEGAFDSLIQNIGMVVIPEHMLDRVGDEARLLPFDVNRLVLSHRSILVELDRKFGILVEAGKFVALALGDVLTSARIDDTLLLEHRVAVLVGYRALGHRPLRIEGKALRHLVAALVRILEGGAEVPSLEDRAGHRGLSSCSVQVCGDIGSELLLGAAQQHSIVSIKIESEGVGSIVEVDFQTV